MTLKIDKCVEGSKTVFRLSGRIGSENLEELRNEVNGNKTGSTMDLEYVTLVDLEGVRFLSLCESRGMELVHCSPYIREWMSRERNG